jgi:hypothetical protein
MTIMNKYETRSKEQPEKIKINEPNKIKRQQFRTGHNLNQNKRTKTKKH